MLMERRQEEEKREVIERRQEEEEREVMQRRQEGEERKVRGQPDFVKCQKLIYACHVFSS